MKMQVAVCAASIAVMAMVLLPLVASTSATSQHSAPLVLRSAGSGATAAAVGLQVQVLSMGFMKHLPVFPLELLPRNVSEAGGM